MNKYCWINPIHRESLPYGEVMDFLHSDEPVISNFKNGSIKTWLLNLVKALVYNVDLVLIDLDFSDDEIERFTGARYKPNYVGIDPGDLREPDALKKRLIHSNSSLTLFTSGTTGQPKSIKHTLSSLAREVRTGDKFANDVWGFAYNPTHIAGLQVLLQAFFNNNTLVNLFGASRDQVYETINENKITHISATPTFFRVLLPAKQQLETVKRITLGGERSSADLLEKLKDLFPNAKITNVYASTEGGTLLATSGEYFNIPPHRADTIKIENDELLIHSSLLGKSDALGIDNESWYHTGDIVEMIDDRFFRFVSRKNEMVNTGGYKVNPQEVEDLIRKVPGIADAHVYSKKNSVLGNILVADIVMERDQPWDENHLRNHLSCVLQDYKIPRKYTVHADLEKTRTGKIKR